MRSESSAGWWPTQSGNRPPCRCACHQQVRDLLSLVRRATGEAKCSQRRERWRKDLSREIHGRSARSIVRSSRSSRGHHETLLEWVVRPREAASRRLSRPAGTPVAIAARLSRRSGEIPRMRRCLCGSWRTARFPAVHARTTSSQRWTCRVAATNRNLVEWWPTASPRGPASRLP